MIPLRASPSTNEHDSERFAKVLYGLSEHRLYFTESEYGVGNEFGHWTTVRIPWEIRVFSRFGSNRITKGWDKPDGP